MSLPMRDEVGQLVAAGGSDRADALQAGQNVESAEQPGEGAGGDGAVHVPRPSGEVVQPGQQGSGGEALGPGVVGEAIADVGEELHAVFQVKGDFLLKDIGEGFADAEGPGTADVVGQL